MLTNIVGKENHDVNDNSWYKLETEMDVMMDKLHIASQKLQEQLSPAATVEDEVIEAIDAGSGGLETMRIALDAITDRPGLFFVDQNEIQRRREKTYVWERDLAKANELRLKITSRRAAVPSGSAEGDVMVPKWSTSGSAAFLEPPHELQLLTMNDDDENPTKQTPGGGTQMREGHIPAQGGQPAPAKPGDTVTGIPVVMGSTAGTVSETEDSGRAKRTVLVMMLTCSIIVVLLLFLI
uniref:Uncharacterized protein n=1 Tax=Trypanosoma congolense (strain IL3000) TaxID=1068625 RepID=G0UPH7_TRYCI|nr:conserved hypothetical protein [Trypanosoma congolense IL3000]